jgi:DNA invertase Pin-like site-specific DNA recombinase
LGRLARNAAFLLSLRDAGVEFEAVDMPGANRLVVGKMAMMAEEVGRTISATTKADLAAAKARGVTLGNPQNLTNSARIKGSAAASRSRAQRTDQRVQDLAPIIHEAKANGATSLRDLARVLNKRGIPTARGGQWTTQVSRLLERV